MSENDDAGSSGSNPGNPSAGSTGQENPYRAPEAELTKPLESGQYGSIERTLAGEATLDFGNTLSEAWRLTKGTKRILLLGMLIMYVALFVVAMIFGMVFGLSHEGMLARLAINLLAGAIAYPFFAGVYMTAVRQSVGLPISFEGLFAYFGMAGALIGLGVLVSLGTLIGYMLLVLPGVYLGVAWMLATPLMVDRSMGIWEAMETSRKIVTKKWFTVFFLFVVAGLIVGVTALLIIPLIWTIPWMAMIMGVIYRELAGVSTSE